MVVEPQPKGESLSEVVLGSRTSVKELEAMVHFVAAVQVVASAKVEIGRKTTTREERVSKRNREADVRDIAIEDACSSEFKVHPPKESQKREGG